MPGGLLSLVCYGNENIILNGNPQTTYFYKSFERYTHFSQEPIQIPLDGPNLLLPDAPILLKTKIPRQGDLLSDLVLRITLPDIFSKAYLRPAVDVSGCPILDANGNQEVTIDRQYEFAWVRQIGVRMIDTITFTIGGQIIQQFNSDWISSRAMLDQTGNTYAKWRVMVGDVPECFDPANGIYADPTVPPGMGYPNVIAWRGTPNNPAPIQNNSASIPGRILRIPLGLWFSDFPENSLPLVALQYHDSEVTIQMRPIRDLYTILDLSGARVRPGVQTLAPSYLPDGTSIDRYMQIWNQKLYGNLPMSMTNLYGGNNDISGAMRYFLTDISGGVPLLDGWPLNATLEATYTFLQDDVRLMFTNKTLRYNVRQVQWFTFYGITTRNTYRLDVHNIATRLIFFARRSDAITYRNQSTNLTNWMYTLGTERPFVTPKPYWTYPNFVCTNANGLNVQPCPAPNPYPGAATTPLGRTGINLAGIQRDILLNTFFTANGNALFDSQDSDYFQKYVPFRYMEGNSAAVQALGEATQYEMWPLSAYSFSLNGSSVQQPTGTLNTSRIDRLELDVDVWPIPYLAGYTYNLYTFVETLNFLEISSGLGGLKFAR
jgi:Major capsid protein N-terminus/Large eukaryotic DNA virus major capsid protein